MHTHGFMYIINHGYTQAQVRSSALCYWYSSRHLACTLQNDRIFDIADVAFSQVSDEEKKQYASSIKEAGIYSGYKLRQFWVGKSCVCSASMGLTIVSSTAH